MIVTCPSCSARYRVRDEKIQGKGARINCPKCGHKFVVYGESERFVIGDESPRGMPVTIRKQGRIQRAEVPEDDEAEAPTTVMAHGSAAVAQMRQALQAKQAEEANAASPSAPAAPAPPKPEPSSEANSNRTIMLVVVGVLILAIAAAAFVFIPQG